jgi:uncharacterized membrane protein YeaQ/YmgE (transglycosylase-associated protein family)
MSWIAWIVLGGMAGWVASMLTRNNARMGIIWNIIVGIIGALAGSWILGLLGVTEPLTFNFMTFLVAVGGAVVLLFLFNLIRGKSRR